MMGGEFEVGGDVDSSSAPEYCSLSEAMVTPDSAIGLLGSSEDMIDSGKCATREKVKIKCAQYVWRSSRETVFSRDVCRWLLSFPTKSSPNPEPQQC